MMIVDEAALGGVEEGAIRKGRYVKKKKKREERKANEMY